MIPSQAGQNGQTLATRTVVTKASDLAGILDSTIEYYIDGIIDMGTQTIEVPSTGLNLRGGSFDISQLISSEDNYTMFVSPVGGSGNVLGQDYSITTSGTNSKVYDLTDATGFNAFEFSRVNYNGCTSLGDIYNYRQGLETGTGRFGGSPSLTLHGTWVGGFRITTSIVRSMSDTTTEPLFKAGTAFQMNSRFLTDINCDLGTLQPFCDFTTAMFPNPSTVQIQGALFSRDGVFDANDVNIFSNLLASNLACDWTNNLGISNTFVGGSTQCDLEVLTEIVTQNAPLPIAGTFGASDLQHFDIPANGQLRHIGIKPIEYICLHNFVLEGTANNDYKISLVKVSGGTPTIVRSYTRPINNLSGGRDVAFYTGTTSAILNQNEYVFWEVSNESGTGDCTLELDSNWQVRER